MDIAITGIACRFPDANDYNEFWQNIIHRRNSVAEFSDANKDAVSYNRTFLQWPDASEKRWAAFVNNVDGFDNQFFGVIPKVAETMDPQQRIMLELTWSCLEDAGIPPSTLRGHKVGVILGVFNNDYKELQENTNAPIEAHHSTGTATSIIANRISHFFGFHGPSLVIDTACSGSLNAIHSAIQAINNGDCDVAISGGVNLILTATRHQSFAKMGMLSPTGACHSFDSRADGYVRGEGAGVLLLKPLDNALADGDVIHGVIKGSAINHCGTTYTLTYPSAEAQAEVIIAANTHAGVPVRSIGLIEAHGTGTPKGDPIEFEGLTNAFSQLAQQQETSLDEAFCGVTSVKSNIGHLEAAAGVAGIIKVLQAFKHRKLPPLRNFSALNPKIDTTSTPFFFVDDARDWPRIDADTPRRAGVSSFGFGGTNAHIVLEEAPEPVNPLHQENQPAADTRYLIALSAKSPAALLQRQKDLIDWLGEHPEVSLNDVSATLLTCRDHFAYRYSCVGRDSTAIIQALTQAAEQGPLALQERAADDAQAMENARAEGAAVLDAMREADSTVANRLLQQLGECYQRGVPLDWSRLFDGERPARIALPGYPFIHTSFWLSDGYRTDSSFPALRGARHRVVNVGSSRYKAPLQGNEFFIAGHQIGGQTILPGVAYLELVRAAFTDAIDLKDIDALRFSQVAWLRPLEFHDAATELYIQLDPHEPGKQWLFQILDHDQTLYCRGTIGFSREERPALPTVMPADDAHTRDAMACYQLLDSLQMCYGAGLRSIRQITFDDRACVAHLVLPDAHSTDLHSTDPHSTDFVIHPSLADGALQAAVVWATEKRRTSQQGNEPGALVIPFALEGLELLHPCSSAMTATLTLSGEQAIRDGVFKVDIHVSEANHPERVALIFRGLSLRVLGDSLAATDQAKSEHSPPALSDAVNLYQPYWIEKPVSEADEPMEQVVLVGGEQDVDRLANLIAQSENPPQMQRILLASTPDVSREPDRAWVRPGNHDDFIAAVDALLSQGATFERVLWASAPQSGADFAARLNDGPHSLFALTKAMMRKVKKARFVHFHLADESLPDVAAISGFYRTLRVEKPAYIGRVVHCDSVVEGAPDTGIVIPALIKTEFSDVSKDADVRYIQGVRRVRRFVVDAPLSAAVHASLRATDAAKVDAVNQPVSAPAALRRQGTYLITGGLGALGLIFARFLCSRYDATVYLSGRSSLDEKRQQQLDTLHAQGGDAIYLACDMSDPDSVHDLIATIHASGRTLNGIIHSAGVIEDNFILRKSPDAFGRVITPKAIGTWLLDEATRGLPLDFFVLFSSVTGVLGNMGQCDYAFGNAFEDYFAYQRNLRQQRGARSGKTLSLNWPYWQDGGMRLTEKEAGFLKSQFGIVPLLTEDGIAIFDYALQSQASQLVVMPGVPGERARIDEVLGVVEPAPQPLLSADSAAAATTDANDPHALQDVVIRYLSDLFAKKLHIPPYFERHGFFRDYGFDSVVVIELVNELKNTFGSALPMTLFFEYQTMDELSRFLLENCQQACRGLPGGAPAGAVVPPALHTASSAANAVRAVAPAHRTTQPRVNDDDIAIIGIAGRYPQADSLEQFWNNLAQGRDCVIDVPSERWDARWFQAGAATPGKSYSRWGGFLSDVERFDFRYFNISPKETEIMDPNEWLFLETATHAIEDAGYTADKLAPLQAGRENRVGVYVGIMWGDYQLHAVTSPENEWTTSHSSYWSVANRVSHFFNFSGPSMALDTACSSSLTAIHIACHAIRSGDIPVAIVGGVNLSLHPYKYHLLSNMHFLSSDGRCRSFGEGGTGYVPGEGVGAVVLKPLSQAQEDGDHIYGIIRGTAVNHGGKTSGFTVPNAKRQAELIAEALETANVNPRHISYVEAHGTGTKLGDPIEVSGLNKAFSIAGENTKYCAIGSVKANIGHLEAAAGMSALTKVLLQMKHQTLAPSIQSTAINPFIDFQGGPFRVQQSLEHWQRPVLDVTQEDGQRVSREIPRIAGISSFGAGGSNAHLIVEEYIAPPSAADPRKPALIVLSARREAALQTMAGQLADAIERHPELSLQDVAYTLQVGRVAHEYRLALVAEVAADAVNMLRAYSQQQLSGLITGHRDNVRQATSTPPLAEWIKQGRLGALGEAWANGHVVEWSQLHAAHARRRVSLPGYAFQRQDCWAPTLPATTQSGSAVSGVAALHPLIDVNISTLTAQAFRKRLHTDEFFLNDHRLGDNRILPGAAYIEMALSASELAWHGRVLPLTGGRPLLAQVQNIQWRQPIMLASDAMEIEISLAPSQGGLDFEIYRADGEKRHIYGCGRLCEETSPQPEPANLQRLLTNGQVYQRNDIDVAFKQRGFTFGPTFQVLECLYANAEEALAELKFPDGLQIAPVVQPFILPPSLLDGAFRTALGIGGFSATANTLEVPVALARLQIFRPIDGVCYAYARRDNAPGSATASYHIDLLDSIGNVVVRLTQLQTQAVPHLGMNASRVVTPTKSTASMRAGNADAPQPVATASAISASPHQPSGAGSAHDAVVNTLIAHVIEVTKLDAGEVTASGPLANYGLDSMMILALNEKLAAAFDGLPQTLFYEYQDLASLADFLLENSPEQVTAFAGIASAARVAVLAPVPVDTRPVRDDVLDYLVASIIDATKLDAGEVRPATQLSDYGLDSMMILALNGKLAATFGEVSQTLFYEYQDLDSLADFLCESYPEQAAALQSAAAGATPAPVALSQPKVSLTAEPDSVVKPDSSTNPVAAIGDVVFDSLTAAVGSAAANCSALTPLWQWPLDTIDLIRLQHELDARVAGVDAAAVYRYQTQAEWSDAIQAAQQPAPRHPAATPVSSSRPTLASLLNHSRLDALRRNAPGEAGSAGAKDDIAVIGLSGRYPGAGNVDEFWANLTGGVDSVTDIPLSRWDYHQHYSPERGPKNKVYSKWGGFIDGIDQFDSQYFNISPREAELLDPQERLFLQTAWECISDASYSRHALSKAQVGVYVGVMWAQYQCIETTEKQHESGWAMSLHSSVANRVSFYFNLNGPSVALDTMCSSSLTALHMACQAIQNGDCNMAIAGGINLIVHPMKYYQLGQNQFLSSDGRCRAFGEGGDGYVPGEGMGAVLLKPLQQAITDGDQIYGVIKATAINHGGKTSGFTVPNQAAQSNVISTALARAGWNPASVDYIEAHGTGTMLGDPIEISGLAKAFSTINAQRNVPQEITLPGHCRIGSVKSNIGHLESAAGIAGLTKILLQMRHRQIVPSLHSQTLNTKINFVASPFRVVQSLEPWESAADHPRRAGLSAFGAGGSNAHVLIEEAPALAAAGLRSGEPRLFVLSADSEARLSRYVERMVRFLGQAVREPQTAPDFDSLAFSSLVGRDAMTERLAVVASSLGDLLSQLEQYQRDGAAKQLFRGRIAGGSERLDTILDGKQLDELITGLVQERQLLRLGRLWTTMLDVNWPQFAPVLFTDSGAAGAVRRVSFPPLPLMMRSHWLALPAEQDKQGRVNSLHPLIDENISTLSQQKFTKQLTGQERYLRDHVVGSRDARMILPGSAYIEMIHAAGQLAMESDWAVASVRNLMWMNAIQVDGEPVAVEISLAHAGGDNVQVAIRNRHTDTLALEAELVYRPDTDAPEDEWIDLDALRNSGKHDSDQAAIYADFAKMGFAYGPSYQVTRERYRFADAALSHLCLPDGLRSADAFYLHPSLLDGALRTCLAVGLEPVEYATPIVPFSLGELEFRHPLGAECYAYVTPAQSQTAGQHLGSTIQKHDITLVDTTGRVLARLKDFAARRLESDAGNKAPFVTSQDVQYYAYEWQASPLPESVSGTAVNSEAARVLVLSDDDTLAEALRARYGDDASVVAAMSAKAFTQHDARRFSVDTQSQASVQTLCEQLAAQQLWPTHIVHAIGADKHFDDLPVAGPASLLHAGLQSLRHLFVALETVKPGQALRCVNVYTAQAEQVEPQQDAVSGYARSLLTINHRFELFTLRSDADNAAALANDVYQEFVQRPLPVAGVEVAYRQGIRYQRQAGEITPPDADGMGSQPHLNFVHRGHYVITGGAGKLGLLMAHYLASRYQARIVLSGRSAQPDETVQQQWVAMREHGAEVRYIAADVAQEGQAEALIAQAKAAFGAVDGVLHCAGVASATPITALSDAEFYALIGPKVDGLVALDRATAQEPLSVFINFSSVSAVLGDLGSGAYAAGNRFMDSHAVWRNSMVKKGLRTGQTLSVNWPLWASGQMNIEQEDARLFEFSGMAALGQDAGIIALERALLEQRSALLVAVGDRSKVARSLRIQAEAMALPLPQTAVSVVTEAPRHQPTAAAMQPGDSAYLHSERALKERISTITKLPASDIAVDATFEQLGMDSVMLMELRAVLEKEYDGLPKTAPFEFNTTAKLAGYLCERYGATPAHDEVAATRPHSVAEAVDSHHVGAPSAADIKRTMPAAARNSLSSRMVRTSLSSAASAAGFNAESDAVAIIGLAGEFPGAENLTDFWADIQAGKENLTTIPQARWAITPDDNGNPNYVNRGGFLNNVDCFDPEMFRMSSEEASRLDPQVRVLLRSAWHALENAGYTPAALNAQQVGVYVGAMNEDFTWVMAEIYARTGRYPGAGSVVSELANRISFLMNLRGPSFCVATTCASSLTSVHVARKAILGGECDMALAGGINLSLHPSKYMLLQEMKVLSADGKEHTFDERANGLIPSEGSGMVVLKRLSRALADGDHIYGVLRGSSIGHAGTGAGQYLPNLTVMEDTAVRAINEARIDVNELSYIESHGAATELGDPIELKALSNALRRQTNAQQFCALGTKANLGHMEAASGICSLIKVLLSMQHGRLSPCVNLHRINTSFEHETSAFLFPREAQEWHANARGTRLAGINAYGMGGSTAFMVVESADAVVRQHASHTATGKDLAPNSPQIVVLSALSAERLVAYATELRGFVKQQGNTLSLADLAYSSQIGRVTLDHRLAIVATSMDELLAKLDGFIAQPTAEHSLREIYSGNVRHSKDVPQLIAGEAGKSFIRALVQNQQLANVATLWSRGCDIDWSLLHHGEPRRRVPFPGYPFAKEPCDLYAALRLDAPQRQTPHREPVVADAADALAPSNLPQTWFARTLPVGAVDARNDESLQAFWGELLQVKEDVGSLTASVLLGGAAVQDSEATQPLSLSVEQLIDPDTVTAVQVCTQRQEIALETLVAAGWALLINRHTRVKQAQFGLIRHVNDDHVQMIPARIQVVGRYKTAAWLNGVETQLETCLEHAGASLEQIAHWVGDAGRFDSAVALLADGVDANAAIPALFAAHPQLRLAMLVRIEENGVQVRLACRGVDTQTAQLTQLLEQFVLLLEGLARHPDKNPAALPMRSKGEGRKAFLKTLEKLHQQDQTP
ncbi:SDR family NAD(P)-dependent oxidoreductase [Dickeya fangzhongdai]|uniref:SDR family NAD(P)-dependent oxidoreductase n=7 Tax=Dickeya fangzhongdai TaxID=1778540 RepID=UPI0004F6F6E6|nr:SDR family NAD(P)-dependent oxidoreductase [Dickeya fangzhongdai]AIR71679.1 mycocerosate synthase [Dickeya fangzhongdai]